MISAMEISGRKRLLYTEVQRELAMQAMDYLDDHIDRKVTIREIAGKFHVSETHLKSSFRLFYGMSLYACFKRKKMEKAAEMLAGSGRSVTEIAECLGYENSSKFACAFRSIYGMTPTSYRDKNNVWKGCEYEYCDPGRQ